MNLLTDVYKIDEITAQRMIDDGVVNEGKLLNYERYLYYLERVEMNEKTDPRLKKLAAVFDVCEAYDCSPSTVYNLIRDYKKTSIK